MLERKCVERYINLLCASLDIVPPRVHYGVKEMQSETTIAQATRAGVGHISTRHRGAGRKRRSFCHSTRD